MEEYYTDKAHNCLCYSPATKWGDLEPTMQSSERRKGCEVSTEVTDPAVTKTSLMQDNIAHAYHGMESVAFLGTCGFILATELCKQIGNIAVFTIECLPMVPVMSPTNPLHTIPSSFLRSVLILSSHLCNHTKNTTM